MQQASKLSFKGIGPNFINSLLPFGIIALVAMLVLPLPIALLDTFFVVNITLSLLILMVAMHTHRPLDFSSFPNLLLIATVYDWDLMLFLLDSLERRAYRARCSRQSNRSIW